LDFDGSAEADPFQGTLTPLVIGIAELSSEDE